MFKIKMKVTRKFEILYYNFLKINIKFKSIDQL